MTRGMLSMFQQSLLIDLELMFSASTMIGGTQVDHGINGINQTIDVATR